MLRISKLTDYAMLILSYMARTPAEVISATMLAEALHIPAPTVSKVLKILNEANLVTSVRGAEGGYSLAKPAAEISVSAVIMAMEGALALTECCESASLCALHSMCTLRENWQKINGMVHAMLSKLSILDMGKPISLAGLNYGK